MGHDECLIAQFVEWDGLVYKWRTNNLPWSKVYDSVAQAILDVPEHINKIIIASRTVDLSQKVVYTITYKKG